MSNCQPRKRAKLMIRAGLPRALALHRLLALRGRPARVRLGLHPSSRPVAGHAWVESLGAPVGEDATLLARYPPCETS